MPGRNHTQAIRVAMGERIRQARIRAGLTQEELAAQLGRNQRSISQLENGERNFPASDMIFLAQELGVSILYFYEAMLDHPAESESLDLQNVLVEEFTLLPTLSAKKAAVQLLRSLRAAVLNTE